MDPHDAKSVSSYSAFAHPNADPSVVSRPTQVTGQEDEAVEPVKLNAFKRAVVWVDRKWLKPLLVGKSMD